jgi:RNA polymerase sigma-70 factor (ECF subfamily)
MMADRDDDYAVSDEALLAGISVGDESAILIFVRRYQRRLFGMALTIVGEAGLAEDVTQEAFIRILRHAVVFDARRGSVLNWAMTITRNLAIDQLRVRRASPTPPDSWLFTSLVSSSIDPADAAIAADPTSPVMRALARLPEEQRRAVVLAAIYGRTAAQIAVEESIPVGTAKSRVRLGMSKLRECVTTLGPP